MGNEGPIDTGGSAEPYLTLALPLTLARIRAFVDSWVQDAGGSYREAEDVADQVVAYVDFNWHSLGLRILASNPELWQCHLVRVMLQRWYALMKRHDGRSPSVRESLARARVLALAQVLGLTFQDQLLFDHLLVHGFSVNETAYIFGLDRVVVGQRLREITAAVCRQAETPV